MAWACSRANRIRCRATWAGAASTCRRPRGSRTRRSITWSARCARFRPRRVRKYPRVSELTATDFATTAPSRLQGRVRKVVWLSGTLNQVGGGERLALEGVKHFVDQGITTHLVTWNFHPRALFDGRYSAEHITILSEP